jgi:mRNA-degrading endonuclease YafQ of YafQ-DinJ toxin-antitoxin module
MKKIRAPNNFYKQLEKEAKRPKMSLEELEGLLIGLLSKDRKP